MTDPDTVATYQSVADEYRERHADRSAVADLVDRFLDAVEPPEGRATARVADVGCGPGWESATFAERGHDAVGVDLTPAFLRTARERAGGAAFARMDMRRLGLAAAAFDGLWACASFLHVPRGDAPGTLAEFRRVLRPDGVLCLSVKRGEGTAEGDTYDGDARRFTLYPPDELRAMVEDAGFAVEWLGDGSWVQVVARA